MEELDITEWLGDPGNADQLGGDPHKADQLGDAIDNASDQGKGTWLVANGKRIAAIVPVDAAEAYDQATHDLETAARAGLYSRRRL